MDTSRVHVRNSENISISEDKMGKGYKAQTLPRVSITAPSVSAEPPSQTENIRDSRDKRRDSQGSRGKDRQSREMKEIPIKVEGYTEVKVNKAPRASEENVDIESSRESIDGVEKNGARPKTAKSQRPILREIARQSSKEVYRYTEVEQRQTVLEQDPVVTQAFSEARQTAMPIQIVTTVHDEHGVARKENAVDVPQSIVEVVLSPVVKISAPAEEMIVTEEMTQLKAGVEHADRSDTTKQNGGTSIPIIITTADTSTNETDLPYNPENTIYNHDDDEAVAKSLEEQVIELEKEFEHMQDKNHVENVVEDRVNPSQTADLESRPNNTKIAEPVKPKKGGCSCCKVFAYTVFSLFLTLTVTVCVVMFSNINHPVMNEARLHLTFLEPTRDFVLDQYHHLIKKL